MGRCPLSLRVDTPCVRVHAALLQDGATFEKVVKISQIAIEKAESEMPQASWLCYCTKEERNGGADSDSEASYIIRT